MAWPDGTTIAFRPQLKLVLERLAAVGLPPLGSVVLLLAACRESWPIASSQLVTLVSTLAGAQSPTLPPWFAELPERLDDIRRLPRESRGTPEAQSLLAEVIFEGTDRELNPNESAAALAFLDTHDGDFAIPRYNLELDSPLAILFREVRSLAEGLARFDPATLELRRQTGLDQLVEPAEIELSPAELARSLIARLEDDDEVGGVARVARRLLAAASLPRPLAEREDLPLGGVSDITNRGPLDRLLLTELAHDDLTLAVRVAVNEALYLRRETPPRNPPRRRAVLIDVGLRMWGVPRVYAAAVALALTATSEPRAEIAAYRAAGREIHEANLATKAGLIEQLSALRTEADPSASLASFFQSLEEQTGASDAVLVTTDDVLADESFQRVLHSLGLPQFYIASVNRNGGFRLLEKTPRGSKLVREATLDIDALLAPRARPALSLVDKSLDPLWPAIFSAAPFPLLLSSAVEPDKAWPANDRVVLSISSDRRLMQWTDPKLGAFQIYDEMPKGIVQWFSPPGIEGLTRAIVGSINSPNLHLVTVDLNGGQCHVLRLDISDVPAPQGVFAHGGAIFIVQRRQVALFNLEDGRALPTFQLPAGVSWGRGRFFRGQAGWHTMSFDGFSARLEPLTSKSGRPIPPVVGFVERQGLDGPIGILPSGELYFSATGNLQRVNLPIRLPLTVRAVASGGERLVVESVRSSSSTEMALIDTQYGTAKASYQHPRLAVEPALARVPRMFNLRHKFETMYVNSFGELVLTTYKGRQFRIMLDTAQDQVYLRPIEPNSSGDTVRLYEFATRTAPDGVGYSLREARWSDGRAILDSRGMLHLQSNDPLLPEISLVLWDGALALWSNDGRLAGPRYFTGLEVASAPAGPLFREVLQPVVASMG